MYYSDDLIEEVRAKNDIVDVISGYVNCRKKEVPILVYVRSIMKSHRLFLSAGRSRCTIASGAAPEAMYLRL